jgi:hypothetical protein
MTGTPDPSGPRLAELNATPVALNAWADRLNESLQAATRTLTGPPSALVELDRQAATLADVFQPARDAALALVGDLGSSVARIMDGFMAQVDTWTDTVDGSLLDLALSLATGTSDPELLPDCSRNPRARHALGAARIMARRTIRRQSLANHPGTCDRDALRVETRRLARVVWNLWAAACRLAETDPDQAAHLERLADLVADLTQHLSRITAHHSHHPPRATQTLTPPGRRCVARHTSAQAPPATRTGVGCRWRAHTRPRLPGTTTTM